MQISELRGDITQAVSQRVPIIREQTLFVCQIRPASSPHQDESSSSYTNRGHNSTDVSLAPNVDVVVVTGEVVVTCTETWGDLTLGLRVSR